MISLKAEKMKKGFPEGASILICLTQILFEISVDNFLFVFVCSCFPIFAVLLSLYGAPSVHAINI